MITRRFLLQSAAAAAAYSTQASDSRGPRTRPASPTRKSRSARPCPIAGPRRPMACSAAPRPAYFKMINDQGGVNGRKINLISLDDGYSPPKTVEQVRRLVEQEQVAFSFGTLGTPPPMQRSGNIATTTRCRNCSSPPARACSATLSTIRGRSPAASELPTEGHIYAKPFWRPSPDAKIGALYQNDDFGKDYLAGPREWSGRRTTPS